MSRITKKGLLDALADYPENAQIVFNDDENYRALDIAEIFFIDDDFTPVLYFEPPRPKIIIKLKKHI